MAALSESQISSALHAARARARQQSTFVVDELRVAAPALDLAALSVMTGVDILCDAAIVDAVLPAASQAPGLLFLRLQHGREVVLLRDPWDKAEADAASCAFGRYVEPVAASAEFAKSLTRGGAASVPALTPAAHGGALHEAGADVVSFVDGAVARAYREGASDVHFECDRHGVTAKLRLDGVMSVAARMQGAQRADEAISRIKVLAQLDITERRLPQDGRFRWAFAGVEIDLRVSIMPSVFGEDAVLRLLDKSHLRAADQQVTLASLGFPADDAEKIRWLSNLPNGMVLITGPTGSGKTTTVYAALTEINTGREKIVTIEDPVEYELPGVLQIPVNERKGLTFARGLRSILRHDPDRILVGEIRDEETAAIAVQSALTGHLVFTTVHANSLFDVIGRFRHFGIDMFGFVSSLNGVVVQRLMRQLCPSCVGTREASPAERRWLSGHGLAECSLPAARGCDACRHTGYRGRFVVAEVHPMTDELRDLIMRGAEVSELKRAAFAEGPQPLVRQALIHLVNARTSLEELFRVVGQV